LKDFEENQKESDERYRIFMEERDKVHREHEKCMQQFRRTNQTKKGKEQKATGRETQEKRRGRTYS
jgi:hypothetical protein